MAHRQITSRQAARIEQEEASPQVSARLQDPLLDGTLRFFALVTQQESIAPETALQTVREQVQTWVPGPAAARVNEFFHGLLGSPQPPEAVCEQLRRSVYEDRVYTLLKTLEFRRRSLPPGSPVDLLGALSGRMGILEPDWRALLAIGGNGEGRPAPGEPGALVRMLPVTASAQPGTLWLPVAGINVVFLTVGRIFYVVRRSDHPLRVGRHDLPANVFRRIREDETVGLAGRSVTVPDLRYYFRQASRLAGDAGLSIQVADQATVVGRQADPAADLWLELGGVTPLIRAVDPQKRALEVNGQSVAEAPVWLSDEVRCQGRRLDLRKLIPYARRDTFVFAGAGDACTISNDPRASIHVPDVAAQQWNSRLESGAAGVRLRPGDCPHSFQKHGRMIRGEAWLHAGDTLQVADVSLSVERDAAGAFQVTKRDNGFSTVLARGITHGFAGGARVLDDLTFELQRGDLVCVLGPSGCGKSTLLNVLNGSIRPDGGDVLLDGTGLFSHPALQTRIGFVPQDDLLQENLTLRENLLFAARLRWPEESAAGHRLLVDAALEEIDLCEQRSARVGGALEKGLSGGQRKRVNIGLELVGRGSLLLLDEPTSGLSSGDTRKIIEVLRRRADDGNIVFVVAHQPSARVLAAFDKVLVLDQGGRMAFYGGVEDGYRYFGEMLSAGVDAGDPAAAAPPEPGMIFEALEQRKLRLDGSPDAERRYPPSYWQGRFRAAAHRYRPVPWRERGPSPGRSPLPVEPGASFLHRSAVLLARECLNKLRGRVGLALQLLSAAFLGLAAALACRVGGDPYSYRANEALLNYMFLTVIVCLFLAVSGSVQEIIRDRAILLRERMLRIPFAAYLHSKFIALFLIYACQLTLYLLVGFLVLRIPELFGAWWLFLAVVGGAGLGLGLAISAVPKLSDRAAAVLVPLVIIPQIILSGADPFPFSRMQHLKLRADTGVRPPGIAQIMPSRWAFEGLVALHRDYGYAMAYTRALESLDQEFGFFRIHLPRDPGLKRSDPEAYARQLAQFARAYEQRYSRPLTRERLALFYLVKSGATSEAGPDPDVHPMYEKMADAFAHNATVRDRFARDHGVPGTAWRVRASFFDGGILLLFMGAFLGLAGWLQRATPAVAETGRG